MNTFSKFMISILGLATLAIVGCGGKKVTAEVRAATGNLRVEGVDFAFERRLLTPLFVDQVVNPKDFPVVIVGRYSGTLRKIVGIRQANWTKSPSNVVWRDGDKYFQTSGPISVGLVRIADFVGKEEIAGTARILELKNGSFQFTVAAGTSARVEWLLTPGAGGRSCSVPPPVIANHPWFHNGDHNIVYARDYAIDHGLTGERIDGEFERSLSVAASDEDLVSEQKFFDENQLKRHDNGTGSIAPSWPQFGGLEGCVME